MESMRKGSWDAQEDALLTNCIQKYGEGKWHLVSTRAGLNRCRKSCRLRWLNYLKPNIKRGDFEMDEVDLLIRLHKLLGNRWSLIAGRLPGRTGNDVKNYWNTHGKKLAELWRPHSQDRVVLKRRKLTTISTSNSSPCLLSQDNITTTPPVHHQNIDQFSADTNNNNSNVTHIIGNVISNNNNNNSSNNNGNMNINACTTSLPETPPEDDGNMQWWTKLLGDSTGNSDGEASLAFVGLDNPDPVKDFWTSSTSSDHEEAVDNLEKNDVSYIWDLLHSDNDMF